MKKSWIQIFGLVALFLSSCSTPADPDESDLVVPDYSPCIAASVQATDPIGDAENLVAGSAPDLVSATISVNDCTLTIVTRFAAGTFKTKSTGLIISIDADQNPATGAPNLYTPGAEYSIDVMPGQSFMSCYVMKYNKKLFQWDQIGNASIWVTGDDVRVETALRPIFENEEGRMNIYMRATTFQRDYKSSKSNDSMPDVGLPPIAVQ